jgi:hypothetical protein
MPKAGDTPQNLRPFIFHGLDLSPCGSNQARGECPFCGKEEKFHVSVDSGQWQCFGCAASGNVVSFLWKLHELSMASGGRWEDLAKERKLLAAGTLAQWGVCQSVITGEWLVPGYAQSGRICQLYRYVLAPGGKRRLMATPPDSESAAQLRAERSADGSVDRLKHGLMGLHLMGRDVQTLYVCEGVWDAMALWEVAGQCKIMAEPTAFDPNGGRVELGLTQDRRASLLGRGAVVAVPSCNVWNEKWSSVCAGRRVVLLYHSDHARKNPKTGASVPAAGYEGMKRTAQLIVGVEPAPSSLNYLRWGPAGFDPSKPSGYDVRDALGQGAKLTDRVHVLEDLLFKLAPVPTEWLVDAKRGTGRNDLQPKECTNWAQLVKAWRLTFKWTDGLDRALSCMLACVVSTKVVGDQLWMKVIGPPACGKSVLCEALTVARRYVLPVSIFTGFHSGYRDHEEGKDVSLISKARDKTMVTKDGDTLLQSPNLSRTLSEARDLYDRVARTHYRNKVSRNYEGLNITWILCGTEALRNLDASELGERFLDCVVIDEMSEELEEEIGMRVAYKAAHDLKFESNGRPEGQHSPDRVEAMQLTGGYVEYLRENAVHLLNDVAIPDWASRRCHHLGLFTSRLRARPSDRQGETAQRELSFRLTSQLIRLAGCLSVVLNREVVDEDVMRRVTQVALDTSRGRSFDLVRALYQEPQGMRAERACWYTNETKAGERRLLEFLAKRQIGVVEKFHPHATKGFPGPAFYRLSASMRKLYTQVMQSVGEETEHATEAK